MTQDKLIGLLPVILLVLIGCVVAVKARLAPKSSAVSISPTSEFAYPEYKGPLAFFRRHYNGDYSLARSYWINTFLVSAFAPALGVALLPWLGNNAPARYGAIAFLFVTTLGIVAWFWAVSGTWASANKHEARGGKPGWATAAKVVICLGLFRTLGEIGAALPTVKALYPVAIGQQLGPETRLQVRSDGRSILLSGGINDGSAEQLEAALKKAPTVATVVLASAGGWVREGEMLADVIRKRRLSTYVENYCASACTIAFLAGKERAAAPFAKIGFHASRSVGNVRGKPNLEDTVRLRKIYRDAGLPAPFIAQAIDTPHETMWHPSHDELLAAGVVTRTSLGGETTAMSTDFRSKAALVAYFRKAELFELMAKRFPADFERVITAAWQKTQKGATDAEVLVAARKELIAKLPQLVALASDDTVLAYHALTLEQLEALQSRDTAACVEMAFPSGKHMNILTNMPPELRQRDGVLVLRALREADGARRIKPGPHELARIAERAARNMKSVHRVVLADEAVRKNSEPGLACASAIAFTAGLNAFPPSERAYALRVMFTSI